MRYILFLITLVTISTFSFAQTDSATVVHTKWQTKKIGRGIKLKQYWFSQSLFNSNQNISILEIKANRRNQLDVEAEPQQLKITSEFGIQHNALAALNGTFFDIKNGGSVDYVRVDGKVINPTKLPANGKRAIHQKAAISIKKGQVEIQQWDGSQNWEDSLQGEDIMVTGPMLRYKKEASTLDTAAFFVLRHPRTALAIKGNKILLITVDGRHEKAAGMSLYELANFLKWMKAEDAINLDGGGSTTLWINEYPANGVINYPCDLKKWDHTGERPVANVIVVSRK